MEEKLPRISVVTPSYNQGQYIEQTILSVISQDYPNLEYIVMDGGSTDNTVQVLEKYDSRITYWQSKKDNGQAAAINEGFARATGEVLCWLNSDDMYMPGTLLQVGRHFRNLSGPALLFGNALHFYENSAKARGSDVSGRHATLDLRLCDYIIQPSSFWTRETWEKAGPLNESFHFTFDWEWFIRVQAMAAELKPVKDYLSLYRIHDQHKSGAGGARRAGELGKIYGMYSGPAEEKAYLRWARYSNNSHFFQKLAYAADKYDFNLINHLIHLLLFSSVPYRTYRHIIKM